MEIGVPPRKGFPAGILCGSRQLKMRRAVTAGDQQKIIPEIIGVRYL
jgi:hypothetical protein